MNESRSDERSRIRDLGVARLRRSTRLSIVGATALAGAFAGAAAHSNPGHKAPAVAARRRTPKTTALAPAPVTPAPTTDDGTPPPAAAPPPPPPVATTAPPVATTGAT
jgi:hypothetical protein